MNAEEKEYMEYLIHNRTQLTNQITRHLDDLLLLQKKLDIAVKALKEYTIDKWQFEDEYYNYPFDTGGWCHAEEALREIDLVGTSEKEKR